MAFRKRIFCTPQDYYDVECRIHNNMLYTQCRKHDKFILHKMKRENFVSTKNLQNAIKNRYKTLMANRSIG